jgi:hypothetical protein
LARDRELWLGSEDGRVIDQRRLARQKALEGQVGWLERRIQRWQATSRRLSWVRLGIVLLGGVAVWGARTLLGGRWAWVAFCGAFGLFVAVAYLHRRLEGWILKFKIWRDLRADQLARLTLNWEAIPQPELPTDRPKKPLDVDLDITGRRSLHHLMDVCVSRQGSQRLADWLVQAAPDLDQINRRQGAVRELVPLRRLRDRLRLEFRLVSRQQLEGAKLLRWFTADFPARRLKWTLLISAVFALADLTLFILNNLGILPAYWVVTLLAYIVFYFYNIPAMGEFLEAVVELDGELDKFRPILRSLETYPYAGHPYLAQQCAPFHDPDNLPSAHLRKLKLVTAATGVRMNPVLGLLLNFILPWDFACAYLAGRCRQALSRLLPAWLEAFYQLEALLSLANFACLNPEYTFPEIVVGAEPVFSATSLGHPLIPPAQKACNDFSVAETGRVAVITGSNMAGKSTFIKAVGLNFCLAYAGGPVNAASFRTIPFRLHTCMRITDSVTDGFSYFYAEVKCLKRLLDELQTGDAAPLLYLIDEIFRGTNNRERLIGSQAYVKALIGANGVGLLATHDLELAGLAEGDPRVSNFHFRDFVQAGQLVFDYTIRPGPSPTTNALKIMRAEGLPVEE